MSAHAPGFLALVNDAKTRIKEIHANQMPALMRKAPETVIIDVREESEYAAGHVFGAAWLGKGIIERDVESKYPDKNTPLHLYCGGGYRSALATDSLQKMGYTNVYSIDGGWRALKEVMPIEQSK